MGANRGAQGEHEGGHDMGEIGPTRGHAHGVVGGRTRRGLLGPAAGMVGLLAAACAGREAARTSSAPSPSGQPVRLRYMGRGTIANQDLQKAGLAAFQKAEPKITVEFE